MRLDYSWTLTVNARREKWCKDEIVNQTWNKTKVWKILSLSILKRKMRMHVQKRTLNVRPSTSLIRRLVSLWIMGLATPAGKQPIWTKGERDRKEWRNVVGLFRITWWDHRAIRLWKRIVIHSRWGKRTPNVIQRSSGLLPWFQYRVHHLDFNRSGNSCPKPWRPDPVQ